jgi:hypothetical protein
LLYFVIKTTYVGIVLPACGVVVNIFIYCPHISLALLRCYVVWIKER